MILELRTDFVHTEIQYLERFDRSNPKHVAALVDAVVELRDASNHYAAWCAKMCSCSSAMRKIGRHSCDCPAMTTNPPEFKATVIDAETTPSKPPHKTKRPKKTTAPKQKGPRR